MRPVIRKRRRERKPFVWNEVAGRLFWAVCLTAVVSVVVGGSRFAYGRLLGGEWIRIREVRVEGAKRVGGELADYLQLTPKMPLSRIEPEKLAARLEKHLWIRKAGVERRFPHTLVINLVEREPALLQLSRRLVVIDSEGRAIKTYDAADALDLPVVTGIELQPVTQATEKLRRIVLFVRYWDSAASPVQVGEVRYLGRDEVLITPMGGGPSVMLSLQEEEWPTARRRLRDVLSEAKRMGIELRSVDLNYPDRAVAQRRT